MLKLDSPSQVRALLNTLEFSPSKVLGQNFLIDGNIREIILDAVATGQEKKLIEIGPGLGMITQGLLERDMQVVAIEKDDALAEHLRNAFGDALEQGTLRLIHEDALKVDFPKLLAEGFFGVVSNLPYSVGNRILVDLALADDVPDDITIMVQRDVAERIAAAPGGNLFGVLSVFLQLRYRVRIVKHVSPRCFVPAPRVWSSIVQLRRDDSMYSALKNKKHFTGLVKHCFSQRRKQMQSILRKAPTSVATHDGTTALDQTGISGKKRPETVSVEQWISLSNNLAGHPAFETDQSVSPPASGN